METKKTERASLEEKRNTYFLIGLVLVLALTWYSFEIKSWDKEEAIEQGSMGTQAEEDQVINTQRETPPPPPPQAPPQVTDIKIVDNDVKIEDDFEINAEADDKSEIKEAVVTQKEEETAQEEEIFVFVEAQPEYPGGDESRIKFLRDNVKYPETAKEMSIQGTVFVQFVVEKDGSVSKVTVVRGIGGGCDEEAVRVVKMMPKWKPGQQRGRNVRAQFNMPIKFTLSGGG